MNGSGHTIGFDIAKSVFQVRDISGEGKAFVASNTSARYSYVRPSVQKQPQSCRH